MGRDSSGTYTRTQSNYSFNTVISETQINSELNDIASELTASLEASGKKAWTGNQNCGSQKMTALAAGSALTDSTNLGQVQNGATQYAAGSGTNTIVATMAPAITAYAAGQTFRIKMAAGANTGATTLNLNSVGAKAITKRGTTALAAGDIPASIIFEVAYDGTQFQLINVGQSAAVGADAITGAEIADNAIDSEHYTDGSIDVAHMSANSVDSDQYVDGSIDLAHMSVNSIDSDQYVDGSIDSEHLATGISLNDVLLKDYGEVNNAIGATGGGTQDIDLTLGNYVTATVDTSTNTFTFSNPTASDEGCSFTLILTNGGSQTVAWPSSVDWPAATAPELSASGTDILVFTTNNGGVLWHGMIASTLSS